MRFCTHTGRLPEAATSGLAPRHVSAGWRPSISCRVVQSRKQTLAAAEQKPYRESPDRTVSSPQCCHEVSGGRLLLAGRFVTGDLSATGSRHAVDPTAKRVLGRRFATTSRRELAAHTWGRTGAAGIDHVRRSTGTLGKAGAPRLARSRCWLRDSSELSARDRNPLAGHWRLSPEEPGAEAASTAAMMRAAASSRGSCSHTRTTVQPAARRASSAARSLATLRSSFGPQYPPFTPGFRPCSGQQCQKQPSTNTATLARVKTMSGRGRTPSRSRRRSTR